jgi:uncharacterized protein YbjT (DUF2867 family)
MSLLIIGGTGTLGRQVVLQALTKGYPSTLYSSKFSKSKFFKRMGS